MNLALTDLGAAVFMYPLAVASAWSHHWLGGDVSCIYYGLAGFFFGSASVMNLTALAVVRFIVSLNLHSPSKSASFFPQGLTGKCSFEYLFRDFSFQKYIEIPVIFQRHMMIKIKKKD